MDQFEFKQHYERRRPHIHPPGSKLFITFRLADSIPKSALGALQRERERHRYRVERLEKLGVDEKTVERARNQLRDFERGWFRRYEDLLHDVKCGPKWLSNPQIRRVVSDALFEGDGRDYRLLAFCIMSNHVHLVLRTLVNESDIRECSTRGKPTFVTDRMTMPKIMQKIKGASARKSNLILGRSGAFWEHESYDHYVRDHKGLIRVIRYTIRNPVKAGLVTDWKDWEGTYLNSEFSELFP